VERHLGATGRRQLSESLGGHRVIVSDPEGPSAMYAIWKTRGVCPTENFLDIFGVRSLSLKIDAETNSTEEHGNDYPRIHH